MFGQLCIFGHFTSYAAGRVVRIKKIVVLRRFEEFSKKSKENSHDGLISSVNLQAYNQLRNKKAPSWVCFCKFYKNIQNIFKI